MDPDATAPSRRAMRLRALIRRERRLTTKEIGRDE
jgi:hypothetical protein